MTFPPIQPRRARRPPDARDFARAAADRAPTGSSVCAWLSTARPWLSTGRPWLSTGRPWLSTARPWVMAAVSAALFPTAGAWPSPLRRATWSAHRPRTACEGGRGELPETLEFTLQSSAFPGSGRPDVAVHIPRGFDATRRPGLLVYFHGWQGCVRATMSEDDVPCHDGGDRRPGSAIAAQVDRAGVNALAVAIELRAEMPTGEPGNLASPGAFRALLQELLADKLAPYLGCPIDVDGLDRIVLVAHSGCYRAAASVLALGDVPQIREVVLLDALYGAQDVFLGWMLDGVAEDGRSADAMRRFVDIYTCCAGTAEASQALARAAWSGSPQATGSPGAGTMAAPPIVGDGDPDPGPATSTPTWWFEQVARAHDVLPRTYVGLVAASAGFEKL
jgi:hypothetical protein